MPHRASAIALVCLSVAACTSGPTILSADPPNGALLPGRVVLVDDGSCPPGQIKQVTGASNRVFGTEIKRAGAAREYACVQRP